MISNRKIGSHFGTSGAKWKLGAFVKSVDSFGQDLPSFNLKGETKVNTHFGGVVTVLILLTALAYASLKAV